MARGESPFQGRYVVPDVDFSAIERGGAAWGEAYKGIGQAVEKYGLMKDKKKETEASLKASRSSLPMWVREGVLTQEQSDQVESYLDDPDHSPSEKAAYLQEHQRNIIQVPNIRNMQLQKEMALSKEKFSAWQTKFVENKQKELETVDMGLLAAVSAGVPLEDAITNLPDNLKKVLGNRELTESGRINPMSEAEAEQKDIETERLVDEHKTYQAAKGIFTPEDQGKAEAKAKMEAYKAGDVYTASEQAILKKASDVQNLRKGDAIISHYESRSGVDMDKVLDDRIKVVDSKIKSIMEGTSFVKGTGAPKKMEALIEDIDPISGKIKWSKEINRYSAYEGTRLQDAIEEKMRLMHSAPMTIALQDGSTKQVTIGEWFRLQAEDEERKKKQLLRQKEAREKRGAGTVKSPSMDVYDKYPLWK